ncbi:hypothetical protein CB0940_05752, partial [Cercospora beticola]
NVYNNNLRGLDLVILPYYDRDLDLRTGLILYSYRFVVLGFGELRGRALIVLLYLDFYY